jgi:hypothetical protein
MVVVIYSPHISHRLEYIISVIFDGLDWVITSDEQTFEQSDKCRINYSHIDFPVSNLCIRPDRLLFETNIEKHPIILDDWMGMPMFFASEGNIPFDIFSAAFYLITRFEEYLPHQADSYGRYAHENSLAFKNKFLDKPLVELWIKYLYLRLKDKFTGFKPPNKEFEKALSFDIDIAFQYLAKRNWQQAAVFSLNLLKGRQAAVRNQIRVLRGMEKDPLDIFSWLQKKACGMNALFFFLVAERLDGYDRNNNRNDILFKKQVKELSQSCTIGLHPSVASFRKANLITDEKQYLEQLIGIPIQHSRQHYIMMAMPTTYRRLEAAGILHEYSMGYGSINGFRASFSRPFQWFDLERNRTSNLIIHPFCWMDANCIFEEKTNPQTAIEQLGKFELSLRQTGGVMSAIFHNHFLVAPFEKWTEVFLHFLND